MVDIGGTTSDVGVLKDGFPRETSTQLKVLHPPTDMHTHTQLHSQYAWGGKELVQLSFGSERKANLVLTG